MTKFTPGPWRACHDGECKCGSVFGGDGNVWVAQVYGPHHQSDGIVGPDCVPLREFQIANAKLIQAAPLLYEALNALIIDGGIAGPMVDSDRNKAIAAMAALDAANEGSDER